MAILVTKDGMIMTATACSTPRTAAMTGTEMIGKPTPATPFTNAPAATDKNMTMRK